MAQGQADTQSVAAHVMVLVPHWQISLGAAHCGRPVQDDGAQFEKTVRIKNDDGFLSTYRVRKFKVEIDRVVGPVDGVTTTYFVRPDPKLVHSFLSDFAAEVAAECGAV
jgi:hypothetical protein